MTLAVFDGHYLMHRVLHVPSIRSLATATGKPTGGVFSFVKSVRGTLTKFPEIRSVIAVFDGGHSKRRMSLLESYKDRDKKDEQDPDGLSYSQKFSLQFNYLKFILPRMGVKVVIVPGREGDDVIGLVTKRSKDILKLVVSDDRDMYQLVDDKTHVWRPIAEERVFLGNFEQIAGCRRDHFLLRKAILGDSSDKIPGVHGVGEKTVDRLLSELNGEIGPYPHEDLFVYALDHDSSKIRSIGENYDTIIRNYKLVDISLEEFTDEETDRVLASIHESSSFDVLAVKKLFTALEFYSLVGEFASWITPFQMLR